MPVSLNVDAGSRASTDDIYAPMGWLASRQDSIEPTLARRHLGPDANPARLALFDLPARG